MDLTYKKENGIVMKEEVERMDVSKWDYLKEMFYLYRIQRVSKNELMMAFVMYQRANRYNEYGR